ncbi:hypothetical protein [Psychrobacter sp. DAB_AL43B]|uniref:hypothetical protein n=1 Tax=Psychrobacter sp. DAB_AL43B TaxID=1028416 RepID=UPI0009A74036|nr:hypothetical protein [Psychrobacter sp. DAB_AL43B]SLJ85458.1 hypothetical protein DABAL43B_2273 [Psychrobacter sp. DAB_AL43B]
MSFFTLLILLSLIIIVPIVFVMREKSKRTQTASIQRHQEYLASASRIAAHSQANRASREKVNNEQSNELTVIDFSAQHPFIRLLYNEQVPKTFRATMDDIGQQYESTHHDQITESQLFTFNKLISTRVPELITDYLSLDQNYAKTVIIDNDKQNTSYDMVLGQLNLILDFSQKLNTQSQSGVVDKLLASRRYLDDVYKESGMAADNLKLK